MQDIVAVWDFQHTGTLRRSTHPRSKLPILVGIAGCVHSVSLLLVRRYGPEAPFDGFVHPVSDTAPRGSEGLPARTVYGVDKYNVDARETVTVCIE